jgi:hypothetical protein
MYTPVAGAAVDEVVPHEGMGMVDDTNVGGLEQGHFLVCSATVRPRTKHKSGR